MRLGIDFGTTRIVVAAVDRGNYPIVSFDGPEGEAIDWFPPLVAVRGKERRYGWEAWAAQQDPSWTIVRSLKRTLESSGPGTTLELEGQRLPLLQVLTELVKALHRQLREHSSLPLANAGERLEIMLGVPANANSNQRFLTVEAFRQAGFDVLGLLNEPSAASIEFGHKSRGSGAGPGSVLVYDLGGGTFDASLVEINDRTHSVIATEGIPTLGGDDFDGVLAELALDAAHVTAAGREALAPGALFRLQEECRMKKEALHPNTRRIIIDLEPVHADWGQAAVAASDYYEQCRPLVDETVQAVQDLLAQHQFTEDGAAGSESPSARRLEAIYVTGGGSEMPLVSRALREIFGRRVKRSAHARAATALGLAIQADQQAGYVLRERFTRYFGVWREADSGTRIVFDPLFPKGTSLPGPGETPLVNHRAYCPVHNVGHFRYLECTNRGEHGEPKGEITVWDEIRFPFDPALQGQEGLDQIPVEHTHSAAGQVIEETYSCDASGTVSVSITNRTGGYSRQYRLGRWAGHDAPVVPGKKKKTSRSGS